MSRTKRFRNAADWKERLCWYLFLSLTCGAPLEPEPGSVGLSGQCLPARCQVLAAAGPGPAARAANVRSVPGQGGLGTAPSAPSCGLSPPRCASAARLSVRSAPGSALEGHFVPADKGLNKPCSVCGRGTASSPGPEPGDRGAGLQMAPRCCSRSTDGASLRKSSPLPRRLTLKRCRIPGADSCVPAPNARAGRRCLPALPCGCRDGTLLGIAAGYPGAARAAGLSEWMYVIA